MNENLKKPSEKFQKKREFFKKKKKMSVGVKSFYFCSVITSIIVWICKIFTPIYPDIFKFRLSSFSYIWIMEISSMQLKLLLGCTKKH